MTSEQQGEVVSVSVGQSLFAIDIMSVREIRGWTGSTPLPHSPSYVLGVLNLRGTVLPVVDLGARLHGARTQPSQSSVVVVVEIDDRLVGLLVDAVCDIVPLSELNVQPPPEMDGTVSLFVRSIMSTGETVMSLLSLAHVLPRDSGHRAGAEDRAAA